MKCYLISDEPENKIIKVQDEDLASFKERYANKILLEGDSVQDLLIKLSESLSNEKEGDIGARLFQ